MSLFGTSHDSDTSTRISVVASTRAKCGHEEEVGKGFTALVEPSRREPGCLSYYVFEDAHYVGRFFTYEEWANEDALRTHLHANRDALNKVKALLAEDLRISVLKPLV